MRRRVDGERPSRYRSRRHGAFALHGPLTRRSVDGDANPASPVVHHQLVVDASVEEGAKLLLADTVPIEIGQLTEAAQCLGPVAGEVDGRLPSLQHGSTWRRPSFAARIRDVKPAVRLLT